MAGAAYVIVSAPLWFHLFTHRDSFDHLSFIAQIGQQGDIGAYITLVSHNVLQYAKSFGQSGDIQWLQNIPFRPMFNWDMAALFYAGMALLVIQAWPRSVRPPARKSDSAVLCLIALVVMYIPGVLSSDAPYYLRVAGAWPIVTLAPALTLEWLWIRLPTQRWRAIGTAAILLPLATQSVTTAYQYFDVWAHSPDAALKYGSGATAIAGFLKRDPAPGNVIVLTNNGTVVQAFAPTQYGRVQAFPVAQFLPLPPNVTQDTYYLLDLTDPYYVYRPSHPVYGFEDSLRTLATPIFAAEDPNARIPVARGYRVPAGQSLQSLVPDGPHAAFGKRLAITGSRILANTEQPGSFQVELGLQAVGADLHNLVVSVRAVDATGSTWGQGNLNNDDLRMMVAGQQAVAVQNVPLYAGTPAGLLSIQVVVWDSLTQRSVAINGTGKAALIVGNAIVRQIVPASSTQPGLPMEPRNIALGDAIQIKGVHVGTYAPRQNDLLQLDMGWDCSRPSNPGSRLVVQAVGPLGDILGEFTDGGGLAAPNPDRCLPGQDVIDQRWLRIGARWPAGKVSINVLLEEAPGRRIAAAPLAEVTVQALPRDTVIPAAGRLVDARFADGITLVRASVTHRAPGEPVDIDLIWRADAPPVQNYTVFAHILGPGDAVIGQHDGPPAGGAWPTTFWEPGQVIEDHHRILAPSAPVGGRATLEVGLYDAKTLQRLHVLDPGTGKVYNDAVRLPLRSDE